MTTEQRAGLLRDPNSVAWRDYIESRPILNADDITRRARYLAGDTEAICRRCGAAITLADDGAWEDESGGCGCGDGEHEPGEHPGDVGRDYENLHDWS